MLAAMGKRSGWWAMLRLQQEEGPQNRLGLRINKAHALPEALRQEDT